MQGEIWMGGEIGRFEGVQAQLRSARLLIGRDDALASQLLSDAMEALGRLLGEAAHPVAAGQVRL